MTQAIAQNIASGVQAYVLAARELGEDPASAFRRSHARRVANDLPRLDRDAIGHLKFNLAKTIQTMMRNADRFAKEGLLQELQWLCSAAANALERIEDQEPLARVRPYYKDRD